MAQAAHPIRVNHFATYSYGGASIAAQRLHQGLRDGGLDSRFLFHRGDQPDTESQKVIFQQETNHSATFWMKKSWLGSKWLKKRSLRNSQKRIYQLHNTHIADRTGDNETYGMARLPSPTPLDQQHLECDVVHLHWLSFFADYPSFFQSIPDTMPIVFTLHDMHSFTGGCHYAGTCDRFKVGCGHCPQIHQPSKQDVSVDSFNAKRTALRSKKIHVVGQNDWLIGLAKQSRIWPSGTQFHKIHLGIDVNAFQPIDSSAARQQLGVAENAIVIAFGADDVQNPRKGFKYLCQAIQQIASEHQIECLIFGAGDLPAIAGIATCHRLGFIDSAAQLATIYSAADVVVVPSLEDNQPQVGLEAMACGTPVVGFNSGGIPEYVRHGETGLVAKRADNEDLARQMVQLIEDRELSNHLGRQARSMIEREFEVRQQTAKYVDLYQHALGQAGCAASPAAA